MSKANGQSVFGQLGTLPEPRPARHRSCRRCQPPWTAAVVMLSTPVGPGSGGGAWPWWSMCSWNQYAALPSRPWLRRGSPSAGAVSMEKKKLFTCQMFARISYSNGLTLSEIRASHSTLTWGFGKRALESLSAGSRDRVWSAVASAARHRFGIPGRTHAGPRQKRRRRCALPAHSKALRGLISEDTACAPGAPASLQQGRLLIRLIHPGRCYRSCPLSLAR